MVEQLLSTRALGSTRVKKHRHMIGSQDAQIAKRDGLFVAFHPVFQGPSASGVAVLTGGVPGLEIRSVWGSAGKSTPKMVPIHL